MVKNQVVLSSVLVGLGRWEGSGRFGSQGRSFEGLVVQVWIVKEFLEAIYWREDTPLKMAELLMKRPEMK